MQREVKFYKLQVILVYLVPFFQPPRIQVRISPLALCTMVCGISDVSRTETQKTSSELKAIYCFHFSI